MKTVELYARVRHAVLIEGISERAAADRFGINARTVSKMLKFSVPPGYVRTKTPFRPKLDAFTWVIDAILAGDKDRPKKQRHIATVLMSIVKCCERATFAPSLTRGKALRLDRAWREAEPVDVGDQAQMRGLVTSTSGFSSGAFPV